MLTGINTALRRHKRLLTLPAILLAALTLAAAHSTMTGNGMEHSSHHGGDAGGGAITTVMIMCLAIVEVGVAVALTLAAIRLARRAPLRLGHRAVAPIARTTGIAHAPPPPSLSQLQSFLR